MLTGPSGSADQAHPRVGGENLEDHWEVLEADGSSPRRRGKHSVGLRPHFFARLIPA